VKIGCAMAAGCYTPPMSRDKRLQDRSIYPHWCTEALPPVPLRTNGYRGVRFSWVFAALLALAIPLCHFP
jgi:hypothetical protein